MRTVRIIGALTFKETIRSRLYLISIVVAFLFWLVSLAPLFFGAHDVMIPATKEWQSVAVLMVVFMGVPMLKFFCAVEVIGLSCGAISTEIERGLMACILPKPIRRWQVVAGKWIAINLIMLGNLVLWSALLWISLRIQKHESFPTLFYAGVVSFLYSVIFSSVTLFFSTFCTAPLAASFSLLLGAAAWPHAIVRVMGVQFHVRSLEVLGSALRYVVPLHAVETRVESVLGPLRPTVIDPQFFRLPVAIMPIAGGLGYVLAYVMVFLAGAVIVFGRREIGG